MKKTLAEKEIRNGERNLTARYRSGKPEDRQFLERVEAVISEFGYVLELDEYTEEIHITKRGF